MIGDISPGLSLKAADSNSGTIDPLSKKPSSPPFFAETGS